MARCGSGYLSRRIADRGNDGGASDLFDHEVEQPQRLAWLTPGLGSVEWVGRLQHLVPGLGLVSSSTGKETEPVKTVRDELTGNEEHPSNGDTIYDYPPAYDEYEDEEWYSWMIGAAVTYDPTGDVIVSWIKKKSGRLNQTKSKISNDSKVDKEDVKSNGDILDTLLVNGASIDLLYNNFTCGEINSPTTKASIFGINSYYYVGHRAQLTTKSLHLWELIHINCGGNDLLVRKSNGRSVLFEGDYVFDPGGWFLKLSKLEDEFFRRGGE